MEILHPKIIFDLQGQPTEVIISWQEYQNFIETLGLDLEPGVKKQLYQARQEREEKSTNEYIDLEKL
jgi:hypothetical protein